MDERVTGGCGGIEICRTCQLQDMMRNRRPALEQRFTRKLGAENCRFEEFDLGTQLGARYANPGTGRSWAVRIYANADAGDVDGAVAELRAKTGEG